MDANLSERVLAELRFDPRIEADHIGVAANDGIVTLMGHVGSYAEKLAATDAVRRVKGVRAIADEVAVHGPTDKKTSDDEIAKRAIDILNWDVTVPPNAIKALVRDGWITLSGEVEWHYQKKSAEDDVRKLSGVVGVTNNIRLAPHAVPKDVKDQIEKALIRQIEAEARAIRVTVDEGHHVRLEGKVRTWAERAAAESAAYSVPGVCSVEDRLSIG